MSDPNPGQEPLPVIPVNDLGQFTAEPLTPEPVTPERKGHPIIAWIVIGLCVAVILRQQFLPAQAEQKDESISLITMKMQAKYLVGSSALLGKQAALAGQARSLNTGPIDQRLRAIVVEGDLSGPKAALDALKDLQNRIARNHQNPTATQIKLIGVLRRLYQDYANDKWDAPSLTAEERTFLRRELDWFGELALAPSGGPNAEARGAVLRPAYRTVFTYLGVFGLAALVGLGGLTGLIIFLVLFFRGRLQRGVHCGSFHGGVYAEAFALWLAMFIGLSYSVRYIPKAWLPEGDARFAATIFLECLTLCAVFWPVLRGVPWRQVRWEVGLNAGRRPTLEPFIGLAGNAMAIPLLALGVLLTFLLILLRNHLHATGSPADNFNPSDLPSHPIVKELSRGNWKEYLELFVLASIVAPIVEETMFRGVLYRHLREATCNMSYALSVFLSACVVSFVFAVIHPQGFLGVPPLMALAFVFCLLREWRGTLVPGMVAHGVNNGVVLLISIIAMAD
jgi:membrane protease YdiL (CAAX protease family)